MDIKGLKKLIKESVREAIQEELKDILLEAIRSPKNNSTNVKSITENVSLTGPKTDVKLKYGDLMGGFERGKDNFSFNSSDVIPQNSYVPSGMSAGIEGTLHPGELGLDQIMNLMGSK